MYTQNASRGFTLIELLVVVAIIALLISILLPSLKQAREQAKLTVCMSNVHQISNALYTYASDYNGYLPYEAQYGFVAYNWWGEMGSWIPAKYLADRQVGYPNYYDGDGVRYLTTEVLLCPGDRKENPIGTYDDGYDRWPNSYRYRIYDHRGAAAQGVAPTPLKTEMDPTYWILHESWNVDAAAYALPNIGSMHAYYFNRELRLAFTWSNFHPGRRNILFLDGHVETWKDVTPEQALSLGN